MFGVIKNLGQLLGQNSIFQAGRSLENRCGRHLTNSLQPISL